MFQGTIVWNQRIGLEWPGMTRLPVQMTRLFLQMTLLFLLESRLLVPEILTSQQEIHRKAENNGQNP